MLFLLAALIQEPLPPPFPRDGATKILENARVVVWDVSWEQGHRTPLHRHRFTALSVTLTPGRVKSIMPDGTERVGELEAVGNVMYGGKGLVHQEEGVSEVPRRVILLELKEEAPLPLSAPLGSVPAWPREGATKLLDNDRVVVWDYAFAPDRPVPEHFHDKDAIVVELAPGATRSVPREGSSRVTEWQVNRARFAPRGRLHREEHVRGSPRAIVIELK